MCLCSGEVEEWWRGQTSLIPETSRGRLQGGGLLLFPGPAPAPLLILLLLSSDGRGMLGSAWGSPFFPVISPRLWIPISVNVSSFLPVAQARNLGVTL